MPGQMQNMNEVFVMQITKLLNRQDMDTKEWQIFYFYFLTFGHY